MFTAFSTALSALRGHATAVDVVGHNLANLNTAGFKASAVAFYDLVSQSLGSGLGETQVGFGVGRPTTIRQFTQGALRGANTLDVAIQGDGFLVVREPSTGLRLYSRGGNLTVDKTGNLTTASGDRIQGWMQINGVLATNGPVTDITVPLGLLQAPRATTNFSLDLNLDATATAGPPPASFISSIESFDSLGTAHVVTVTFTRGATANAWDYAVTFPAGDTTAATPPVTGTLQFDGQGKLVTPAAGDPAPSLAVTGLVNGADDMDIAWNLYNGVAPRMTQYAQPSAVAANEQDGVAAAQLVRVSIGLGGTILAQFSNGNQSTLGQFAMASIRNPESLLAVGDNNYQLSARTALPAIGLADTGGRGSIVGGSIENSNVEIATEFTNLIMLQRGYQANARVVTTVDELSQETINLKR